MDELEGRTGRDKRTGRPVVRQGGRWVYADTAKLTEDQGKSQGYAKLMADAEERYGRAVQRGYNPASFRNSAAAVAEGLPFGGLDGLGLMIRDDAGDLGRQAELQFSDAQLKAMSGAAAPEAEVKRGVKTFFPRPGENIQAIGPEKEMARREAFEAARRRAGPAAQEIRPPAAPRPPKRPPVSPESRAMYDRLKSTGRIDGRAPRGSQANPFVATSQAILDGLPSGSYAIDPQGNFVVIE